MIRNIKELAAYAGVPSCFEGDYGKAVERLLFKYTECGCTFSHDENGVAVSGYAEGADAECQPIRLEFPFTEDEWDVAVQEADDEGVAMWHEWNDEDDDMQDIIDSDNRDRAADMNATLRGGW